MSSDELLIFWGMDVKHVPVWQKADDVLQNMIDAQQDEGKKGKQSKGEYTAPSHCGTQQM